MSPTDSKNGGNVIMEEQTPRPMSPPPSTAPLTNGNHHHRLPRPYLNNPNSALRLSRRSGGGSGGSGSSEEGRDSPRPRSGLSNISEDQEALLNPESSILFSKSPTTTSQSGPQQNSHPMESRSSETHHHHQKKVTITTRSEIAGSGKGSRQKYPSTSSVTHTHTRQLHKGQTVEETDHQATANGFDTAGDRITETMLSPYLNPADLEANLRRSRTSQIIAAYLDLSDMVRRMNRDADLREDMLKRSQRNLESKDRQLREKESVIRKLQYHSAGSNGGAMGTIHEEPEGSTASANISGGGGEDFGARSGTVKDGDDKTSSSLLHAIRCRFHPSGCPYRLPSMDFHEERECRFRPTRCPSLTCPARPPFARLLQHIQDEHDGTMKGRDRICRNSASHLVSSYVNIDKEPVFYKTSKMTWVANELLLEGRHFFLECFRCPPDWHLWVYLVGSEREAEQFHATIQLFREDEYGRVHEYSKQRSWTGPTISIHRSKEEIAEYSLGFQVHDKQIRSLCGPIRNNEEQLFGYEVTVYRK